MCSKAFSLLLSVFLLAFVITPTCAQSSQAEKLRRKVIEWGTNQPVTVQLNSGEKVKGRTAAIKFDTLSLQLLEQGRIVTRDLRWDEMHKVARASKDAKARKIGGFIVAGVLATLAIVVVVALNDPNF